MRAISGTSAPRVTTYSFEEMSTRKASGKSHSEFRCWLIDQQSSTRKPAESATRMRRPLADRSISGPRIGETTAKGAMVSSR